MGCWKSVKRGSFTSVIYLFFLLVPLLSLCRNSYAQSSSPPAEANQLLGKGLSFMDSGDNMRSNIYLKKAADLFETSGNFLKAAHCYNHLSSNNRLMSNLDIARRQAEKALALLDGLQTGDPTEKIRAYTNLGLLSAITADYEQSLRQLEKASVLLDAPAVSTALKMVVTGSLGYLYDDLGKYDKALYYYNDALDLLKAQSRPSKSRLAKLYNNIGVAYSNKGLYKQARHYYQLELEMNMAVKGKDHPDIAGTYLNIGNSYFRMGDVGQALLYFKRAHRTILNTYGRQHEMTVLALNSIAKSEMMLRNYEEAIQYLNEAIAIKIELVGSDHPELAFIYHTVGKAYAKLGEWQKTFDFYQKALVILKKSLPGNHPQIGSAYNKLATYYLEEKRPRQALKILKQAEDILLTSVGSRHPFLADTYSSMGRAYAQLQDVVSSISRYQQALSIIAPAFNGIKAKENPDPASVEYPKKAVNILFQKAKSLCNLNQQTSDLSLLEASLWTYMALSKLLDRQQWGYNQMNSKLSIAVRSHEIYEQAIKAAYSMYERTNNVSYFQLVFYFSEKSKGRVLLEAVAHTNDKQFANIPASFLQQGEELRYKVFQIKQTLYESFNATEDTLSVNRLKDSLFVLNRKLADFTQELERRFPRYHRLKYSSVFPYVYKIQQRLAQTNTIILEYFYGEESLFAIVLTADKMWVEPLNYAPGLPEQVTKFTDAIIHQDAAYSYLGYKLYKQLIKPVLAHIKSAQTLRIVPSGPLHLLPFEALLTDSAAVGVINYSRLPYLINTFNISYSNSIALNAALSKRKEPDFKTQFIGFAPFFSGENMTAGSQVTHRNKNWKMLTFSGYEVETIASLFNEGSSFWNFLPWNKDRKTKLFIQQQATEDQFKHNSILRAKYIHLATHAFIKAENTRQSGIVFYQNDNNRTDDILYANEIYNLQFQTQLIVLSACRTGMGNIVRGEGIMGLSRAFQYAGAENLLVSLWKVGDRSTASLMVSFYTNLHEGNFMPFALSEAKRTIIKNMRYAHPRYWAAFKLIGAGGR